MFHLLRELSPILSLQILFLHNYCCCVIPLEYLVIFFKNSEGTLRISMLEPTVTLKQL